MKIIKTREYMKIAGSWDIYPNFHKHRDRGDEGSVLFQQPCLPKTEDDIKEEWGKKKKKKKSKKNK